MDILGYKDIKLIHASFNFSLWEACRIKDNKRVLLQRNALAPKERSKELDFFSLVDGSQSSLPTIDEADGQVLLVLEYFNGLTLLLQNLFASTNIAEKIKICISLSKLLEKIHDNKIIHNHFAPYNILLSADFEEARIFDFSNATFYSEQNQHNSRINDSTFLSYISPELTGKVGKLADYRSDLYSLGVMFYELFSGVSPFYSEDPYQMIHFHLAKRPVPLNELVNGTPESLSQIVQKLLSKDQESRYQTAIGLRYDLERCHNELKNGFIESFLIGSHDVVLKLPDQLFGRETEINKIKNLLEQASNGEKVICLVSGMSGSGKSSLIKHIHERHIQSGFFLQAKSNQFDQNYPYSVFIQIITDFVNAVLRENESVIKSYGSKIRDQIGSSGKVLTDLVPELELIIGKQQEVTTLPMAESGKRFSYTMRKFFKIISADVTKVIVFFDDLQWLDKSSFDLLMEVLSEKDINNIIFIGAVREEEPREVRNNLLFKLSEINEEYHLIPIADLSNTAIEEYVATTLNLPVTEVASLAQVVYAKTSGNPFFASEFLRSIVKQKLLCFDKKWVWDLDEIKSIKISDNAVKFIESKLKGLPDDTSRLLQIASCLGSKFNPRILQIILPMSLERIKSKLDMAFEENLLIKSGNDYRFSHDGIQQAANALITDPQKMHLQIARSFKARMNSEELESHLLDLVYHYNFSMQLVFDEDEKFFLSQQNYKAAKKMKTSAAFQPFYEFSRNATLLLFTDKWKVNAPHTADIYSLYAEAAYLTGNFEEMEIAIEEILANYEFQDKKIKVYEIRILAYIAQSRLREAIDIGLYVLGMLDIKIPGTPNKLKVLAELVKVVAYLKISGEDLLTDKHHLNDERIYSAIRIICSVGAAAYNSDPNLYALLSCKAFELIIRNGHCEYSGFICASFGSLLIGGLGKINFGYKIGNSAGPLLLKHGNNVLKCKTVFLMHNFVMHWKHHLRESLQPLAESSEIGLETGDTEYSAYCIFVYNFNAFFCGLQLDELKKIMLDNFSIVQSIKHKMPIIQHGIYTQTVVNLISNDANPLEFKGEFFNEKEMLSLLYSEKVETSLFEFHLCKMYLHYLFGNINESRGHAHEAKMRLSNVIGSSLNLIFYFYDSLSIAAALEISGYNSKSVLLGALNSNLKKLKAIADNAPMNGLHKYYLVKAELLKLKGRPEDAIGCYQKAIELAKSNRYLNEEALGYELLAKFYYRSKNYIFYESFLAKAIDLYSLWGAKSKVSALRKSADTKFQDTKELFSLENEKLTLHSLLKSASVLSEEIVQEKLFRKLIKIIMEHGGAHKAGFFINTPEKLKLVAFGDMDKYEVDTSGLVFNRNELFPDGIIGFASRKKETVILKDACTDVLFSKDLYILKFQPKSIIVFPLIDQGKLEGMLYLENNLTANIFSARTTEFLKILSGQLTISLRNSRFYEALEGEVLARTKELTDANLLLTKQGEEIFKQNTLLKEARDRAEESLKVKEDFLSLMSHEILTPLNVILGFTDLLMLDKSSGPLHDNIRKIKTATSTLQSLINDILYSARIGSDKIRLVEEDFDLHELMMGVRLMFHDMITNKGLEFIFNMDPSVPHDICGDKNKLNQILINLIGNAVKFTHKGKIEVDVRTVKVSEEFIYLEFSVSDTGIGIEEDKLDVIFQEFTQASSNISKNYGGSGLGLAIVQKLIKLYDGNIKVQSAFNKGSVFTFNIKLKWLSGKSRGKTFNTNSGILRGKRILLVDDEPLNLELAGEILKKREAEVSSTVSSFQAIEMIKNHDYDIVVTDLKMAEMSGADLCKFIRRSLSFPKNQIPVLVLTAHIFKQKDILAEEAGVNDVVYKPVNAAELVSAICKLIGHSELLDDDLTELIHDDEGSAFPYLSSIFQDRDIFNKHLNKHIGKLELYTETFSDNINKIAFKALALTIHSIYNVLNALDIKNLNDQLKKTEEVFENTEALTGLLYTECGKLRESFSDLMKQTNEN
ncbi:MAG: AAA family ATPase [Sporocytophaga sp.]|uniref:AAA family ATPase n=1 Tax=Sporocytophaga sp. TaxID=2231183 RepID=UPI001B1ADB89|nr:AAA family ATPase [Sporocytophaga sp.]MBO9699884.1 AAA family ATPase [Sporocytophaga sp.]